MRAVLRFLGMAGAVLLAFGLASYGLGRRFDLWTAVHVTGGAILVATAIASESTFLRRWLRGPSAAGRARSVAGFLLLLAVLAAANVAASRSAWRWDVTEGTIHTPSEATSRLIAALESDVTVTAVYRTDAPERRAVARALDAFEGISERFRWTFLDPEIEPVEADRLEVGRTGILVAECDGRRATGAVAAGAAPDEAFVAHLVRRVRDPVPRVVYASAGTGEPSVSDLATSGGLGALALALAEENAELRDWPANRTEVPADASVLVVPGPTGPLDPARRAAIAGWLGAGGSALFLFEPGIETGLESLAAERGIVARDDLIVERRGDALGGSRIGIDAVVERFADHPATASLASGKGRLALRGARSLRVDGSGGAATVRALALTGPEAWGELGWREAADRGVLRPDGEDEVGSLVVAAAAESPGGSRLAVVGDADFARNAFIERFSNREALLSLLDWLAGDDRPAASRARGLRPSRLDLTEADFRNLFRLGVMLLPESVLIVGLAIWWRRRSS